MAALSPPPGLGGGMPAFSGPGPSPNPMPSPSQGGYGVAPKAPAPGRPAPYEPPPGLGPPAEVNELGLPIRPGREQCLVYLNTGVCQNGLACIFDHPKGVKPPLLGKMPPNLPGLGPGTAPGAGTGPSGPSGAASGLPPPPMPGMLAPSGLKPMDGQGTGPLPGPLGDLPGPLIPGGVSIPPLKDGDLKIPGKEGEKGFPAAETKKVDPPVPVQYNDDGLPIRPGVQKCGFYLRSGSCNYGPTCRFDHPPGLGGIMAGGEGFGRFPLLVGGPATTEGGLARRPGKEQCPFLARTGSCPFGPECRFDHVPGGGTTEAAATVVPRPVQKTPVKDKGLGGQRSRRPPPVFRRAA